MTQFEQDAGGSLEFAAAETGVEAQIVAAAETGRSGNGCPAAIALEFAEKLAAVDIGSSCVVAVQDPDRAAERCQDEG